MDDDVPDIEVFADAHADLHRVSPNSGCSARKRQTMEAVMIPAKTVVHIGGVQARLATDTIVEVAYGDMASLVGYHYAHLPEAPSRDSQPVPA